MTVIPRVLQGAAQVVKAHWLKPVKEPHELPPRTLYEVLKAYYLNNSLYHEVQSALEDLGYWQESMEPLRNPTWRVVEFYVAKLWPGALPDALTIKAENDAINGPIQQIWRWSNWSAKKQVAARWLSLYGDWFCKIVGGNGIGRVYLQNIEPHWVSDFDDDERGFITYIRVDTPQQRRNAEGNVESYIHTEVWDKARNSYRVWEHDKGMDARLDRLGDPDRTEMITDAFGIDFIPFVRAPKMDIGEKRGLGAVTTVLHKIDEANRQATRLHQLLFRYNKPDKAVKANMVAPDGRPYPPPKIAGEGDDTVELGDETIYKLPGNSSIEWLVPDLDYRAHLDALRDMMLEIEDDLPELMYYRLKREQAALSGRALEQLMAPAHSRVLEARGNALTALVRANQMALTIAQVAELEGFEEATIGTFAAGDFEHTIEATPLIEIGPMEKAQEEKVKAESALIWQQVGVSQMTTLERLGFDPLVEEQRRQARAESLGEGLLQAAEGLAAFEGGG